MSLDSRYMIAPSLEQYFVDKETGLPLAAGIVTFYKDQARTEKKPVYKFSGTAVAPTYTALPNPCVLSSAGTFIDDSGNDILPYYFPYDSQGNVELYYITVESSETILQFTREAYPNFSYSSPSSITHEKINYATNGQFLTHIGSESSSEPTEIKGAETHIDYGNWLYLRDATSAAVDKYYFNNNSIIGEGSQLVINKITPDPADTYSVVALRFKNVSTFGYNADADTQQWTFAFKASVPSISVPVDLEIKKNYGTGGSPSPEEETIIQNFIIAGGTPVFYSKSFVFGSNVGKTFGSNDDSYIEIRLVLPSDSSYEVTLGSFILYLDDVTITTYPITTDKQARSQSLIATIPTPDDMQLYLPLVLSPNGFEYDDTLVGSVFGIIGDKAPAHALKCDGTVYDGEDKASDGVPYLRLLKKLQATPVITGHAQYSGLWEEYGWADQQAADINYTTSTNGATTSMADGAVATGFTFADIDPGSPTTPYIGRVTNVTSAVTSGAYFLFYGVTGKKFVVWFKKDGAGTQPLVSGAHAYIKVDVTTDQDPASLIDRICDKINSRYLKVPELGGVFLRGLDVTSTVDPDAALRTRAALSPFTGENPGTFQEDVWQEHAHQLWGGAAASFQQGGAYGASNDHNGQESGVTAGSGGNETRPKNIAVIYYIKH